MLPKGAKQDVACISRVLFFWDFGTTKLEHQLQRSSLNMRGLMWAVPIELLVHKVNDKIHFYHQILIVWALPNPSQPTSALVA